jgi:hypothetical protein
MGACLARAARKSSVSVDVIIGKFGILAMSLWKKQPF